MLIIYGETKIPNFVVKPLTKRTHYQELNYSKLTLLIKTLRNLN